MPRSRPPATTAAESSTRRRCAEGGCGGGKDGVIERVGRFWYAKGSIPPAKEQRLREIHGFFDEEVTRRLLVPVATQTFGVSLRLLDYTMTNWAKKTRVMTMMNTSGGPTPINIFSLYKDWLHFYRRRGFDSFRRRERVYFRHEEETMETTVAQLNFLRWAEMYGVLEYVVANKAIIEEDMMSTLGDRKRRHREKEEQPSGKRTELSRAPAVKCVVYPIRQQLRFDDSED
jgi:hypothetical protein